MSRFRLANWIMRPVIVPLLVLLVVAAAAVHYG